MIYPDALFRLSEKGCRNARLLMWFSIVAGLLHIAGAALIDPQAFLLRQYGNPSGIGVVVEDFAPLIVSTRLVSILGIASFLYPAAIYVAVWAIGRALSKGRAFSANLMSCARLLAMTVVGIALAGVLLNTLTSLVRLPGDTDTTMYLMITSGQLVALFLGITLVALVSILRRARLVAEDSAAIV